MRIDVFSIFPDYLEGPLGLSLIGKARARGQLDMRIHDPRSTTTDRHHRVDDAPVGGGAGMVMMAEPLFASVEAAQPPRPHFLLGPGGRKFDQAFARELSSLHGFSLLCGRYEGVDQRVSDHLCDGEVSVGDYVLAGGEAAALVIIEAVARLVPGVLGNEESTLDESFAAGLLEYPQYAKPAQVRGWGIPEVLRSGDHGHIAKWRRSQALRRTLAHRPDLLTESDLTEPDQRLLDEYPADL